MMSGHQELKLSMPRLEFVVDWQRAEGVQGQELSSTWAYLVIRLDDTPLTRVLDHRAKTVRDGVFVPVYPLAEWLVTNWWTLLYEAENPDKADDADFIWRHSIAYARQGYALPNLQIVSTESRTRLRWEIEDLRWSQVEFLGPSGEEWIDKADFRDACERFVDAVVRRLAALGVEGSRLQEDWVAIRSADPDEAEFCHTAGAIGWDPYALDDRARELILKVDRDLSDEVLEQASSILSPDNIDRDLNAIIGALRASHASRVPLSRFRELAPEIVRSARTAASAAPWQLGFALAQQTRRHLGLNGQPLPTFEAIAQAIREDPAVIEAATAPMDFGAARLVGGVVSMTDGQPPGFAFQVTSDVSRRFHFCRALAETLLHPGHDALITRAISDRQSLSRAFAAEFLAPGKALRESVTGTTIGDDDVHRLMDGFGVSSLVIQHQLENHNIARVSRSRGLGRPSRYSE
jgi:hypothetical protein